MSKLSSQPQRPLPISEAPVNTPVLGVWLHVTGDDFCSCYVTKKGQWLDTAAAAHRHLESALLAPPDGWLPLPILEVIDVVESRTF